MACIMRKDLSSSLRSRLLRMNSQICLSCSMQKCRRGCQSEIMWPASGMIMSSLYRALVTVHTYLMQMQGVWEIHYKDLRSRVVRDQRDYKDSIKGSYMEFTF